MWIRTGISQLMPSAQPEEKEWGHGEQGLLARTYFTRVLFPELRRYWARRDAGDWRRCSVPLGATLTRLVADTMQLTPGIRARNLHWATSTEVTVDSSLDSPLKFRARVNDRNFAGAGRIAGLPTRADGNIPPDTLLTVFAASSGYPVVFGPQKVLFTSDSSKYPCGTPKAPCDTHPGLFVDGGVFDNGPLSLGLALYFEGAFWTQPARQDARPFPYVLYIAPGHRRQLADGRSETLPQGNQATQSALGGLGAGFRLFGEAIPAAREYELQFLTRLVADVPPSNHRVCEREKCFIVPDRWHPLMGERIFGFGGFLGRPLREYDFYVGIYDALALLAQHIPDEKGEGCSARSETLPRCAQEHLAALISAPPVDSMGQVAPCVLRNLFKSEFGTTVGSPERERECERRRALPFPSAHADSALRVVTTIADLMAGLMHDTLTESGFQAAYRQEHCPVDGPLHGISCDQGVRQIAVGLDDDKVVRSILEDWKGDPTCKLGIAPDLSVRRGAPECYADEWFFDWVEHPTPQLHKLFRHLLKRLDFTTPHGPGGNLAAVATVHALGFTYFSSDAAYRRGFDMGQTSLPVRGSKAAMLGWALFPSSANVVLGAGGLSLTWEVRHHTAPPHMTLVLPVRVTFARLHMVDEVHAPNSHAFGSAGLSVGMIPWKAMRMPGFVTSIRADLGSVWFPLGGEAPRPRFEERLSYGATFLLFNSKLRASLMRRPRMFDDYPQRHWLGELGLNDLNGLSYWIYHLAGH
jgi:hypothetical protein